MFGGSRTHAGWGSPTNRSEISHRPSCFLPPGWDIFPPTESEPLWPPACCDRIVPDFLGFFKFSLLLLWFGFCCVLFVHWLTVNMQFNKNFFFSVHFLLVSTEKRQDNGRVYFVNHNTRTTQWDDPRTQGWDPTPPPPNPPNPNPDAYEPVWVCMSLAAWRRYAALAAPLAVVADRNVVFHQKATALIWKVWEVTSASATFKPLIPKLGAFRQEFKTFLT